MIFAELIADAAGRLAAAGCESPRVDAEALVMHTFGLTHTELIFARRDPVPEGAELVEFQRALARRQAREPLQHIVGTAPMMGLELQVGTGVFVPRPETELLAQWAIDRAREAIAAGVSRPKIVDLCTGSGALALAIADAVPTAEVIGVELDPRALQWAQRNVDQVREQWAAQAGESANAPVGESAHAPVGESTGAQMPLQPGGSAHEVQVIAGDVTQMSLLEQSPLAQWRGRVDIVVSNPPYVPEATSVSEEVRRDPHHAVFGGADGLQVIRPMLGVIAALLHDGGAVGIEHDDDSGAEVLELLRHTWPEKTAQIHQDLAGRDRFTTAAVPGERAKLR